MTSVMMFDIPLRKRQWQHCELHSCHRTWVYVSPMPPFMKHFPFMVLFQFASKGVQENTDRVGMMKLNTVTIRIDAHTIAKYSLENLRAKRYAQIEYLSTATAWRFMICPIHRK